MGMDILPTLLSTSFTTKTALTILPQLLLGQTVNATVTARQPNNTLILQINNQQIEAKTNTDKPINIGEQLKLFVEKKGDPTVLRVIQQNVPEAVIENRQQLLRENLPKQQSMEKLTQLISQITNNTKNVVKALPVPIEKQMQKLIENLPTKSNLKNETQLKTVIKNSGIFLETKLISEVFNKKTLNKPESNKSSITLVQTNQNPITKDLKANLLQLAASITKYKQSSMMPENPVFKASPEFFPSKTSRPVTTKATVENTVRYIDISSKIDLETVSKQIESSIARIEVNQSKAIVTNDNPIANWSVEIPVKDKQDIDLLKLDIQTDKDPDNENNENQVWTVNLRINFENIGAVSARLSLYDKEISATLWSEDESINNLINNYLPSLEKQISRCGLLLGKIECLETAPPELTEQNTSANELINISV